MKKISPLLTLFLLALVVIIGYYKNDILGFIKKDYTISYDIGEIPEYNGQDYVVINNNEPNFDDSYKVTEYFEIYNSLDELGRTREAFVNASYDVMPTKERERIGMIKPSGWHVAKYDIVEDEYLYNRCHLIAYQLTGENANEKNLITCTKYMNSVSMLEFENKVANYIRKTKNHVLYRVTPIYKGNDLLATGVQMEAYSVEDSGKGIKFNVFVYNIQDGIEIDYSTGESRLIGR